MFRERIKFKLKSKFELTVTDHATIRIMNPTFGDPLDINVPMSKTLVGVSQVFLEVGDTMQYKKKKAFSGIGFILAIFMFGIALFITMEYYHIFTTKKKV